jgi:hypothetical protein
MSGPIGAGAVSVAAVAIVLGTAPVRAQTTFELIPSVGYYLPTANFSKVQETAEWLPDSPRDQRGLAIDVDARWWFHNSVGLQLQAGVAYSTMHFQTQCDLVGGEVCNPMTVSLGMQVQTFSAQIISNAAPPGAHYRVWFGIGPAVVHRGAEAFSAYDSGFKESYDVGAALGTGGEIPIGKRLRATIDLESFLYWVHVDDPYDNHSMERGFQTDLMLHAGVAWSWRD